MVVEVCEKFLLDVVRANFRIFNQSVADIVSSHAIQEELSVLCVFFLLFFLKLDADEVPERIRDQCFHVLHLHQSIELLLVIRMVLSEFDRGRYVSLQRYLPVTFMASSRSVTLGGSVE